MRRITATVALATALVLAAAPTAAQPDWVEKSNAHAQIVLDLLAELSPEGAGNLGVDGLDAEIFDLGPGIFERSQAKSRELLAELERRLADEDDRRVRQDLGILIKAVSDSIRSSDLEHELMLPYFNLNQTVFFGIRSILDPQNDRQRYPAAVTRIEKYAGIAEGYTPITELAMARTRERFDAGLVGPYRGEVEQDLERAETMISGIEALFDDTDLEGWQASYETLAGQLREYKDWVRAEVLPRARADYRLPVALYEDGLRSTWGVEATPAELIEQASKGYADIRNEMQALAPLVAEKFGYETNDYREVIALLKRDGAIDGDRILAHYEAVLSDIEDIIVRERLVTLPERDAGIKVASAAETAAQPAPHLQPPRLIGNTGEYPIFVLPQLIQNEDGSWQQTDDTYAAGAWTLTAHEARPGHEMQFSSIVESGVSVARAVFAFNSANVEGWGLYAEAIVRPYLPIEGQLISLQYRLMRAARMFLDPMLNLGLITPEEAKALIMSDIGIGESWAQNEVERYTYRMPGQATAYYYGYNKMQALRTQTELKLRDRFDQQAYHDFILAQGLLPPELLRQAVMEEFVPSRLD